MAPDPFLGVDGRLLDGLGQTHARRMLTTHWCGWSLALRRRGLGGCGELVHSQLVLNMQCFLLRIAKHAVPIGLTVDCQSVTRHWTEQTSFIVI